jgi:hypothetical protein
LDSIQRNEFIPPLLDLNEEGKFDIQNGNHRVLACQKLKYDDIVCSIQVPFKSNPPNAQKVCSNFQNGQCNCECRAQRLAKDIDCALRPNCRPNFSVPYWNDQTWKMELIFYHADESLERFVWIEFDFKSKPQSSNNSKQVAYKISIENPSMRKILVSSNKTALSFQAKDDLVSKLADCVKLFLQLNQKHFLPDHIKQLKQ